MRITCVPSVATFSLAVTLIAGLSAFASPTVAQDAAQADSGTPAARQTDTASDRQHRTQEITGSRMGKRICATPEQWAQADAQAAEAVRQMKSDVNNKAGIERPGANPFGGAVR
jgi:hypothetical protein